DQAPDGLPSRPTRRFRTQEGSLSQFSVLRTTRMMGLWDPPAVNDDLNERLGLRAIPARTNETHRYREGTWEIGHTPGSSAAPKTRPRSRNWVLGNRSIGRGYRRECRSWSMRKRITATPLPCE